MTTIVVRAENDPLYDGCRPRRLHATPQLMRTGRQPVRPMSSLSERLQRLDALIEDQRLNGAELLEPLRLAEKTALPESTVRTLLAGGTPPREEVGERVCARVRILADAHLARTGRRKPELVAAVHRQRGVSEVWARQIIDGRKVPSVELLHALVKFFDLNDARALMKKYGVAATDMRHHGSLTAEQLETLLAGVIKSVMPPQEDNGR
ncbi:hypothetical protein [Streptomyces sp. NPDC056188]|uniref:hypothetical protein n=1 Tax=Streptomyces sp. NPDC056188 TaxID=3345740 RepID=UPI0035E22D01